MVGLGREAGGEAVRDWASGADRCVTSGFDWVAQVSTQEAQRNALRMIKEGGMEAVKLEGAGKGRKVSRGAHLACSARYRG